VTGKTPVSARIPQWSISEIEPILTALSGLAAASSSARVAQQLGVSPTGGKFRSQLGTARYYGVTRRRNGLHELTARGQAIVGDDEDAARQARRESVMSTALGPVLRKFAGREPNEATIAARLEDDFGATTAASAHLAGVLVRTAQEAELLSNHRFDVAAIESVGDVAPPETVTEPRAGKTPTRQKRDVVTERETPAAAPKNEKPESPDEKTLAPVVATRPFGPAVQVVVKVDAAGWTPEQVAQLVRELNRPPETEEKDTSS
jgi:hypothetical protein